MILKKTSFILTFVFLLSLGSAYAAAQEQIAEKPRFAEIRNDSMLVGQFDTTTLKYEKDCYRDELLINVWIKTTADSDSGDYNLYHYLFRQKNREFMLLDQIHFNSSGKIIHKLSNTYDANSWTQIIPETVTDKWYSSISKYAQDNDRKLKKQYKLREKVYNEENTDDGFLSYFSGIPLFHG